MSADHRQGGTTPRRRARALLRGRPDGVPLFLPLAVGLGSRVEGWAVEDFLGNPTLLTRGLEALAKAAALEAIFVAGPAAAEAEALGAALDWSVYPPRVTAPPRARPGDDAIAALAAHPRLHASLEATRRLMATVSGEPLLAAAITGPWTLAGQLAGPGWEAEDAAPAWLEFCGRSVADLARRHCEAGSDLVVLCDDAGPSPALSAAWDAALAPVVNTLGFHRKLLVTLTGGEARGHGFAAAAVPRSVGRWAGTTPTRADVVVTDGELPLDTDLTRLGERVAAFRGALA